jgi:hypothetical protein
MKDQKSLSPSESHQGILRVECRYFTAGAIIGLEGKVVFTAPIIKYMNGWTQSQVEAYCKKKGWSCEYINNRYRTDNSI